jgi:hypothetical protein
VAGLVLVSTGCGSIVGGDDEDGIGAPTSTEVSAPITSTSTSVTSTETSTVITAAGDADAGELAQAFCDTSNDVLVALGELVVAGDFPASLRSTDDLVQSWRALGPDQLADPVTYVADGWDRVAEVYADSADRDETIEALAALIGDDGFQDSVSQFGAFSDANCPQAGIGGPGDDAARPEDFALAGLGRQVSAAGITFSATQCTFEDGDRFGLDAFDHFASVAVTDDGLFLAGQDGGAGTGLMKFLIDGPGCSLTTDVDFGADGVLILDEEVDHVSGSDGSRVVAGNSIFGVAQIDGETGDYIDCREGDFTEISPDGQVGYGFFPGTGDLNRYQFDDGECVVTTAAVTAASQSNPTAAGWFSDELFLLGGFVAEGGAAVTAMDRSGNELWTVGGSPGDIGDLGYGAVSALSRCGDAVCVVDSNFRELHILDPADGSQLGLADLQELVGAPVLWFNGLTTDGDDLWLVGGLEMTDDAGQGLELIQGLVFRIELS